MQVPVRVQHRPVLSLCILGLAVRVVTLAALFLAKLVVPTFDPQAQVLFPPALLPLEAYVRWDTLYFVRISLHGGYVRDQEVAFMPGLPFLMHYGGRAIHSLRGSPALAVEDVIAAGILGAALAGTFAAVALYKCVTLSSWVHFASQTLTSLPSRLTLEYSHSTSFSLTTALLLLVPPSPPTLNAVPYTEPFSALFTFLGMLYFLRRRWTVAAVCWAAGSAFRAQGVVLGVGFFGWQFILEPLRSRRLAQVS